MYDNVNVILTAAIFAVAIVTLLVTLWHYWTKREIKITDVPLPQLGPFDGQGVKCTCEHHCSVHDRLPESVVVGSNFMKVPSSKIPHTEVGVYSVGFTAGKMQLSRYLGAAVRILDWLVVPYHVICTEEVIVLVAMKSDGAIQYYKVDTKDFKQIDGDVASMKMDEATFSKLGMAKAGIAPLEGESMVSITSAAREPEISFGILTNDTKVFGGVVFKGSTRGGFSGAPYMIGKQIAGMHLGGGIMNYGVSASYISALLQKPEDTAEWLQKMRKAKGPLKYQRSKFSPDEAIIFVDGRYHTVDLALLEMDEEEKTGDTYMPLREPEVNMAETFPPQYVDEVRPLVEHINTVTEEIRSKNLQMAEPSSASQVEEYMKRHAELMGQLDERVMLLQSLQDSVANRYREVQILLAKATKGEETRSELVSENEKLKGELMEIKKLKTDVNVEVSSVKAVPKSVRKARAKAEGSTILMKLQAEGFPLEDVIKALESASLVMRLPRVVALAGNAETTTAPVEGSKVTRITAELPSTSQK